jgi:hypothetical protein
LVNSDIAKRIAAAHNANVARLLSHCLVVSCKREKSIGYHYALSNQELQRESDNLHVMVSWVRLAIVISQCVSLKAIEWRLVLLIATQRIDYIYTILLGALDDGFEGLPVCDHRKLSGIPEQPHEEHRAGQYRNARCFSFPVENLQI